VLAQAGAIAARALDPEDKLLLVPDEGGGPALQLAVAGGADFDDKFPEQLPELIQRHREVAVLVGVDPNCDHCLLLILVAGYVEAAGQSCVE
jgi:hypothetical protein